MDIPPEIETVDKFLEELKSRCGLIPDIEVVQRRKNLEFIEKSGITREEIVDIIFHKLSKKHYKKGPTPERDNRFPPGIYYEFIYHWEKYDIFIKIKIFLENFRYPICISFHD